MTEYQTHYLNPDAEEIRQFALSLKKDAVSERQLFINFLRWFDENIEYSRLNSPYFPLQRSDLDVLKMKSGTCGDYSNLIVSVCTSLGIPAKYAYLKRDCYGDEQDHICAAVYLYDRWVLVDATEPYRKWHGFDCPHKEYELLEPDEFEARMKQIERECIDNAQKHGDIRYAGLLYAPWVHDETVINTQSELASVFYLLILNFDEADNTPDGTLYVNYLSYTESAGCTPVMATATKNSITYRVSVNKPESLWDEAQWSEEYAFDELLQAYRTRELEIMKASIERNAEKLLRLTELNNMEEA